MSVPKEALEKIAKTGKCYSNEARDMAQELLELRDKFNKKLDVAPDPFDPYGFVFPTP